MKRLFTAASLLFLSSLVFSAQAQTQRKHFVYFKDKANSPYSLSNPKAYLSQAALQRRENQGINLTTRDLPVNPAYIMQLKNTGVQVLYKSKWFNGAVVFCDSAKLAQINTLPFVKNSTTLNRTKPTNQSPAKFPEKPSSNLRVAADRSQYGIAFRQAEMVGATRLHDQGFHGEGKTIAVFDAGFPGVNTAKPFKHLYDNGQIKGTFNYLEKITDVYKESSHGTQTLSCIGAYQPGLFIGTSYKSNFFLFITEDDRFRDEQRIEEFNWAIAAEYSDSAGVDVISSSLGYTEFDFPSASYTYADMDGNTTIITRAADMAAATGILVVNSAGNDGNNGWHYLSAPSDGDSVLAVGAVDSTGFKAGFSSFGPASDGRIKPNVSAQGILAAVVLPNGQVGRANGTSFSCPIMAGMATAFWQAYPFLTNMEVIKYLQQSATQAKNPDNNLGYGIPNYSQAKALVDAQFGITNNIGVTPNPLLANQEILLDFDNEAVFGAIQVKIFDRVGRLVEDQTVQKKMRQPVSLKMSSKIDAGIYIMQVMWGDQVRTQRLIKLQ